MSNLYPNQVGLKEGHENVIKYKFLMFLFLGIFLISFMSATITVTLPVQAPTNLTATMQGDGSLIANTIYYYVVVAYDGSISTPQSSSYFNYHSPLSIEGNFTTNDTHRSAFIDWDAGAGDVNYQVLLTTNSGNYTKSGGYGTAGENVGTITTTYYNVTTANTGTYVIHSANLVNNLSFGINKSLGIIKVYIDGEILGSSGVYGYKYTLQRIYEEAVSAGYGDYIYWDGYHFAIKGWIVIDGTSATNLTIRNADVTFVKGGFHISNPNAIITFGVWTNDYAGANYLYGSNINLQNARYPLRATTGQLNIYGSRVTSAMYGGRLGFQTELLTNYGYTAGLPSTFLAYEIGGMKDSIIGMDIRSVTSEVYDMKTGIGNNWHNTDSHRLKIVYNKWFCYSTKCKIYDTTWAVDVNISTQALEFYVPGTCVSYSTHLYDPTFSFYYESNNNIPPTFQFATNYGCLVNNAFLQVHNSIIAKVIDEIGSPIEDVTIYLNDKNGNAGKWIEHADDVNRKVTGNEYSLNVSTDANGTIDYYVTSYNVTLNQSNTIASVYCNNYNFTAMYPYTLTFEKAGYKNYTIYLDTLTKKTNLLVSLESQQAWNYSNLLSVESVNNTGIANWAIDVFGNMKIAGVLHENTNSSYINSISNEEISWRIQDLLVLTNSGALYILGKLSEKTI